jgi:hypothetical protein
MFGRITSHQFDHIGFPHGRQHRFARRREERDDGLRVDVLEHTQQTLRLCFHEFLLFFAFDAHSEQNHQQQQRKQQRSQHFEQKLSFSLCFGLFSDKHVRDIGTTNE